MCDTPFQKLINLNMVKARKIYLGIRMIIKQDKNSWKMTLIELIALTVKGFMSYGKIVYNYPIQKSY